ncbi:arylesterase [Marinobacter salinisoli]|uniref:Arylesterase n=1 Tax=Marinobacter salinisoli TaxID=2769486 RepID=A0ABX7MPB3_9GAMM|nr:arylesterase [Marinobacter salinisoli]QSP94147.1 arylesterase [Marinobacter salinisoli]
MNTAQVTARSIVFLLFVGFALPVFSKQSTVLIVGDSLSAAYGVPSEQAWVQLLQQRLNSNGLSQWQVVNASISGETTDGGARRLPKLLQEHEPDVVVIELGGNDGLRGFPPNVIESNLENMIQRVQEFGADAVLVGIQIPPNYGQRYTQMFAEIFPKLSERYGTALVPFFLEGIYDAEGLMQDDGIHPTVEAQPKMLDNVWPVLRPRLE